MGASLIWTGHWDRQLGTSSGPAWFWAALPDKEREAAEGQAVSGAGVFQGLFGLLYSGVIVGGRFALYKGDGPCGTGGQTVSQTVTVILSR